MKLEKIQRKVKISYDDLAEKQSHVKYMESKGFEQVCMYMDATRRVIVEYISPAIIPNRKKDNNA